MATLSPSSAQDKNNHWLITYNIGMAFSFSDQGYIFASCWHVTCLSPWSLATASAPGSGQSVPRSEWWPACTQTIWNGQQTPHRATRENIIRNGNSPYSPTLDHQYSARVTLVMSMSSESNWEMTFFTEGWWEYCLIRVSWICTWMRTS